MQLTTKQEQGLKIAIERFKNREKFTVIGGYAGTGKSTLVKFIINALQQYGVDPEIDVCYAAFTGKATQVLQKKGNPNTSTLHKLLYKSIPKQTGGYIRIPKKRGEIEYKAIVVDETSMVPMTLMQQLFKHGIYLICLGDPFQLPPINPKEDNHLLDNPHIFLDEVMRQAAESEIIRLSMDIRAGKEIKFEKGKECQVLPKSDLTVDMLSWADQVLCATNATRTNLNQQMRKLNGKSGDPQNGDKVICTRNYWDIFDTADNAMVNGTIGYLQNTFSQHFTLPNYLRSNVKVLPILTGSIVTDEGESFNNLDMDYNMFTTEKPTLDWKTSYRLGQNERTRGLIPIEIIYGYAITCHRAQGSEWDKVLVVEEGFPFKKDEHARWLYTACTRAASRLVLVR